MFSAISRKVKRMAVRQQKKKSVVRMSDTTLRDGCQTPGVRLDPEQKVRIAVALAEAGFHSIDVGFPAAGPSEVEAIQRIAKVVKGPVLSAHSRTLPEDIDLAAKALAGVSPLKRTISLFIGTSPLHREHKHEMSKAQVIDAVVKAIEYAHKEFEIISFGPEDASRTEPDFLHEIYEKAIQAGVLSIGFADTVGILTPAKAAEAIRRIQDSVPSIRDAMLGVHFHNDLGLATANSLACIKEGVNIVQGTINGIGERAGNTSNEEVVLALTLHRDEFGVAVAVDPGKLYALSQLVAELTQIRPASNKPVVGKNLFRTESGVHQSAMLKHAATYMPFPPELVGAGPVEMVLGPNSGRSAVRHHMAAAGIEASEDYVELVMNHLKNEQHAPEDRADVGAFLEKMRPFMTDDELGAEDDDASDGGESTDAGGDNRGSAGEQTTTSQRAARGEPAVPNEPAALNKVD